MPEVERGRYAVESKETEAYEDYDANLFVICGMCREEALKGRDFVHAGDLMVPELGCLGPFGETSRLDPVEINELILRHETDAHIS